MLQDQEFEPELSQSLPASPVAKKGFKRAASAATNVRRKEKSAAKRMGTLNISAAPSVSQVQGPPEQRGIQE